MNDVVFQAYKGVGKFKKPKKIYTMFCMYPNLYQIVALKKLGLKSIYDVKGKRVSIGSPGSGTAYKTNLVFGALGIAMDSFKVYRLSFNENANALMQCSGQSVFNAPPLLGEGLGWGKCNYSMSKRIWSVAM
jgi:TRAP transporter TAXI family solute receptor